MLEETNRMSLSSGEGGSSSSAGVGIYQEQPTMKRTIPKQTEQPFKSTSSGDIQTASVGKLPVTVSNVMYTRPSADQSQRSLTQDNTQAISGRSTRGAGTVNKGILINGGNVQGDLIAVNNEPDRLASSTESFSSASDVNHGIRISGGNVNADIISSDGNVSITGGTVSANTVTQRGEPFSSSNSSTSSSASPSNQPRSPASGGKHYNYHV